MLRGLRSRFGGMFQGGGALNFDIARQTAEDSGGALTVGRTSEGRNAITLELGAA